MADKTSRFGSGFDLRKALCLAALALGLFGVFASLRPAVAETGPAVDLQLVLAVDASGSVNAVRFELQKRGYIEAFRNPRILKAIQSGNAQAIAVTMMQWTGPTQQYQVVPWTMLKDEATMHTFAALIERAPRHLYSGGTSISGAIEQSVRLLGDSPFTGGRRVIDVSGDGANNRGRPAAEARDAAIAAGIAINGLPILELEPNLEEYYRDNVIGGPNSFVIAAQSFEEFADAVLKKLITEIAAPLGMPLRVGQRSGSSSQPR